MTKYYFDHETYEKARREYVLYKNGWLKDLEELHKFLFELCDCDIKKAYYLLLQLDGRE